MGDDLIPDEITRLLECNPTRGRMKGQKIERGRGTYISLSGMWQLGSVDREPEDLDSQIEDILGKSPASLKTWENISQRFKVDLFCGLFMNESNEGLSISAQSLNALGSRGIKLDLDIYARVC